MEAGKDQEKDGEVRSGDVRQGRRLQEIRMCKTGSRPPAPPSDSNLPQEELVAAYT
jgi:hypothetical protein